MAATVRVELKSGGVRALLKSGEIAGMLEGKGQPVLAAAQAGAPVETGEYRNSLRVWTEQHPGRVVVHVGSDAPHAHLVEANTGNLARALDAAGGA